MRRMLRTVGAKFSDAQLTEFRAEYDRLYESDPLRLVTPYPGIPELLRELKGRGFRLGVLSNKPDNMTRILAESFYAGLFDAIRGQVPGILQNRTPQPRWGLPKAFSIPPREILYIGDSGVDMLTGKKRRYGFLQGCPFGGSVTGRSWKKTGPSLQWAALPSCWKLS